MPYWSVYCLYCQGYISDALLECVPSSRQSEPAFKLLFQAKPGAALPCPYCNGLIGFDDGGRPAPPHSGWPVFRYGAAEIGMKKLADGESAATPDADWALRCRFVQPGTHQPLTDYIYAEHAPANETVP
jgi:hypothetical protein